MKIRRDIYLDKLVRKKNNGMVKVVTGLRGCGKSYLLFCLFHDHLTESGIPEDHIIEIDLDDREHKILRDPDIILQFIKGRITDKEGYYILIDEIQYLKDSGDVLNSLLRIRNADVYVTGSNSKCLSTDVMTKFCGQCDEIRVYPLSFSEYMSVYQGSEDDALEDYLIYGGLPLIAMQKERDDKGKALASLFNVYLSKNAEYYNVPDTAELEDIIDVISSVTGSYTNIDKLVRTFRSVKNKGIGEKKIKRYAGCLTSSFFISMAERIDVKRKKKLAKISKYYFEDTGLMHARAGFSQIAETQLMENCIYNDLRVRGYSVNNGMALGYETRADGKQSEKRLEVDFVATKGQEKFYIQSVSRSTDQGNASQKCRAFLSIHDSFPKITVVRENMKARCDKNGFITIGLKNFLLGKDIPKP